MCCSFWPTSFTNTITGTWEVMADGVLNHVLWYQNNVGRGTRQGGGIVDQIFEVIVRQAIGGANWREICAGPLQVNNIQPLIVEEEVSHRLAGGRSRALSEILRGYAKPALREEDGNCLVIPLQGLWESIHLLNTTELKNFLEDISLSLEEPPKIAMSPQAAAASSYGGGGGGIVFLQFSIYDIVIAQNASSLPAALSQINPLKRPKINEAVFGTLERWYRCPVAVCCFNNAESGTAKPLAFAFEPNFPDSLIVYTLDAHDGQPPVPDALVKLDHTIFVGSYLTDPSMCAQVSYRDKIPSHISPYILNNVMGTYIKNQQLENGDIVFSTSDVRSGRFDGLRSLPPFAPTSVPRLGHRVKRSVKYVSPNERSNRGWR